MILRLCLMSSLTLCTIMPNTNAEENSWKHSLSKSVKIKKAESLRTMQETTEKEHTHRYVMHYQGEDKAAKALGKTSGLEYIKTVCKEHFTFKDSLSRLPTEIEEVVKTMKRKDNKLIDLYEDKKSNLQKLSFVPEPMTSFNITDNYWSKQWHLEPAKKPSMGVYEAWKKGYSGKGVVIAVLDDGMDINHIDLKDNYNGLLSKNFVHDEIGGVHVAVDDGHGTRCAGIAAAAKNDNCVIGVAYEATIASLRILDEQSTVSVTVDALTHELDKIEIFSNSWGYPGNGYGYDPLFEMEEAALIQGITTGRNGKGAIYIFAAGNDGAKFDDCTAAGHINNIYTISVNALDPDGSLASYSEECTSMMVATYGGDKLNKTNSLIATTIRNDSCTDDFLGTSAACPIAAGIVAFALQANPDLTWRDVQYLIAMTSSYENVPGDIYQTNGAGLNVSVSHGFGLMNADRMVTAAESWETVPDKIICVGETQLVNECCTDFIEATYDVQNCHIKHLEHVEVHVYFEAIWREYIELHLISPFGTDSRILRQRRADFETSAVDWTFLTVFKWGEDPTGNWTIRMDDFLTCDNEIYLYTWSLTLHGTITDPKAGKPKNGTLGGYCGDDVSCVDNLHCLLGFNLCVSCNISDYKVINGYCAKDRTTGGYCDDNNICEAEESWCNDDNFCEQCDTSFRRYEDNCYQDGKLGGFCDYSLSCSEPDVGCNGLINRCINCTNGFHTIRGYCTEDGTIYGYCDSEIQCNTEESEACSPTNNWCVTCYTDYEQHIIDGFCIDDGTIGGFCSDLVPCTDGVSGCDLEMSRCVACRTEGFHIINNICRKDGLLHGYCNETVKCPDDIGCHHQLNVCIVCSTPNYRIVGDGFCREDGSAGGYCDTNITCGQELSGCMEDTNTCGICYAGYHLDNEFCIQGRFTDNKVPKMDDVSRYFMIIGCLFGGTTSGIAISAPICFIIVRILFPPKQKPVTINGKGTFKTDGEINKGFVSQN